MNSSTTQNNTIRIILLMLVLLIGVAVLKQYTPELRSYLSKEIPALNITPADSSNNSTSNGNTTVVQQNVSLVEEESETIKVVEMASPAVVSVVEKAVDYDFFNGLQTREASIGTGFAVEKNLVVSNRHVVEDSTATYSVVDNAGNKYEVTKVYRDPLNDLALLEVKDGNFPTLTLGDSDSVKVGQTAIAIGNALGKFDNTVTKGVISGKGRGITASGGISQYQEDIENLLQTDAALNPGNSGGPLLNIGAQVIGINVAVSYNSENIGFAIPSNVVKGLVDDFKNGVERKRAYLGIQYAIITPDFARNSEFPEGALVRQVIASSPAAKAGIKVNDVIISIDGTAINENNLLADFIQHKKVGDQITVKYWRNGSEQETKITLEGAPDVTE
ncbi:PDZ domain-containing protein [candidate division WWE3 bacterium]|nr:PDZ domain-containing protein [candidate division WWE3 bacterium]